MNPAFLFGLPWLVVGLIWMYRNLKFLDRYLETKDVIIDLGWRRNSEGDEVSQPFFRYIDQRTNIEFTGRYTGYSQAPARARLPREPRLCLSARLLRYPCSRIHLRFSSDLSSGLKPYNSIDFSMMRSVRLFFSLFIPSPFTRAVNADVLLNMRAGAPLLCGYDAGEGFKPEL